MFVESLLGGTDVPYEAIFVDNGSTDGTPAYLAGLRNVRLVANASNAGVARGWNRGLSEARGDFVAICNNDIVLSPGWLGRLIAVLESDDRLGLVVPVTNIHVAAFPEKYPEEAAFLQARRPAGPDWASLNAMYDGFFRFARAFAGKYGDRRLPHPSFDCVVLRREALEEVGPFEEGFGQAFMEDVDFVQRLLLSRRHPLAVSSGSVYVHHYGNRTTRHLGGAAHRRAAERFDAKWGPVSSSIYWAYLGERLGPDDLERLRRETPRPPLLTGGTERIGAMPFPTRRSGDVPAVGRRGRRRWRRAPRRSRSRP